MPKRDTPLSNNKPWTQRERVVPLRTYSGRVVYDRKVHPFTSADLLRITSKVEIRREDSERNYSLLEKLVRFIWELIFAIVPIPGILLDVPQIFIDFYMGWMYDSRVSMPVLDAFIKNAKIFLRRLINKVYGSLANLIAEEVQDGG